MQWTGWARTYFVMFAESKKGNTNNKLTLTFKKDGAVAFAGMVDGAKVSGLSQLVRRDSAFAEATADAGGIAPYQVTLYAPPKPTAKPPFEGWCATLAIELKVDSQNNVTPVVVK